MYPSGVPSEAVVAIIIRHTTIKPIIVQSSQRGVKGGKCAFHVHMFKTVKYGRTVPTLQ